MSLYSGGGILLSLFRLQILSVHTSCQLTRAEESEVGAAMVADGSVRRLPASHKLEDGLRRSEGIGHVLERVEEDLRKNVLTSIYLIMTPTSTMSRMMRKKMRAVLK